VRTWPGDGLAGSGAAGRGVADHRGLPTPAWRPLESLADVPPEHVLRSSRGLGWRGIEAAEVIHPIDDFATPAVDRHVLVFNIGTPMDAAERHSGRAGHLDYGQGVVILPSGRTRDWHLVRRGEVRHLHVYVDPELVGGAAAEADLDPTRVEILEEVGVQDLRLVQAGLELLRELRAPDPGSRLAAEALGTLLAVHLLRQHASTGRNGAPAAQSGPPELPADSLRRATEYVEAHLADHLGLAELAAAAGFSPYHFARLFKAALGVSPHQYVIGRRVARAQVLLQTTDWSTAIIAREVGFATSSHLAQHLRRQLGVSPTQLR
jgi:AraC family transcriptional regulator